jgi:hypothetical protein
MTFPDRREAPDYYFKYIDQVRPGDICEILRTQATDVCALFDGIADEESRQRYAPGKWTIREVVGHLNDTERLFVFRAMWFARGFDSPLPSFEPDAAAAAAGADGRSWRSLVDEFRAIRASTVAFFSSLPSEAWARRGVASDNTFSVRALAYIAAGHVAHHAAILRSQYLGR